MLFRPRIEAIAFSKCYAARSGGTNLVSIWLEIVPETSLRVPAWGLWEGLAAMGLVAVILQPSAHHGLCRAAEQEALVPCVGPDAAATSLHPATRTAALRDIPITGRALSFGAHAANAPRPFRTPAFLL
ncbi:hypothetical protein ACVI1K_006461 [Bradyrhizobium sp. USDA 4508]